MVPGSELALTPSRDLRTLQLKEKGGWLICSLPPRLQKRPPPPPILLPKTLARQNFRDEVTLEAQISVSYSDAKHLAPGRTP